MGILIGLPSLKLNSVGNKSGHCGDFGSVAEEALSERIGKDTDIDPSRSGENVITGFQTAAELIEYSREHIEKIDVANLASGKRKTRKDAVAMIATLIKPPAHWINTLTKEEQHKFLTDAVTKFSEIVGVENIKSIAYHYDEQGAHAHIFWEPMTKDGRLCAKEMHNLKFFSRVNSEIPKHMRSLGWDVDDCRMYDKEEEEKKKAELGDTEYEKKKAESRAKRGRSSFKYKAEAEIAKEKLEANIESGKKTLNDVGQQLEETQEKLSTAHEELAETRRAIDKASGHWTA